MKVIPKKMRKVKFFTNFSSNYNLLLILETDEKHVRTFCPLRLSRYGMFVRGIPDLYELEIL